MGNVLSVVVREISNYKDEYPDSLNPFTFSHVPSAFSHYLPSPHCYHCLPTLPVHTGVPATTATTAWIFVDFIY